MNETIFLVMLMSAPNFTEWSVENEALIIEPTMREEPCDLRRSILQHYHSYNYYWCEPIGNNHENERSD